MYCHDYYLIEHIKTLGFKEVEYSREYKHDNGLIVYLSEHRWSVEHEDENWEEDGMLDETEEMDKIFREYGIDIEEIYKQKHLKQFEENKKKYGW